MAGRSPPPASLPRWRMPLAAKSFLAGCVGGSVGLFVGFPLDTIRIRLQLSDLNCVSLVGSTASGSHWFKNGLDCLLRTVREEGVLALYRGIVPPLVFVSVQKACSFGTYAAVNQALTSADTQSPGRIRGVVQQLVSGVLAGAVNAVISTPIDQIKIRMQFERSQNLQEALSFRRSWVILGSLYRTGGLPLVFRGVGLGCMKDMAGYSLYFLCYERIKRSLNSALSDPLPVLRDASAARDRAPADHPLLLSPLAVFLAGGLTGCIGWSVVYPIDFLKSNIQNDSTNCFRSSRDVLQKALDLGGWRKLYRGVGPTLARAFVTHSSVFAAYEATMAAMARL